MYRASLSEKQKQLLKFLSGFNATSGFPPTIREIFSPFGLKSLNTVHVQLRALENKGYLQIHSGKGRGITLQGELTSRGKRIPVVGRVAAGTPILAVENTDQPLEIDRHLFNADGCFAVCVKGNSMAGTHILHGDYVIIRIRNQAQDGDIVAALIEDEVTLKYYFRSKNQIRLEPAHPNYPSIIFKKQDPRYFKVLGIMAGLIRKSGSLTDQPSSCRLTGAGDQKLYIKIEVKFMGVRPKFHVIDFFVCLIIDPHIEHILGKHIPLHEKRLVFR